MSSSEWRVTLPEAGKRIELTNLKGAVGSYSVLIDGLFMFSTFEAKLAKATFEWAVFAATIYPQWDFNTLSSKCWQWMKKQQ